MNHILLTVGIREKVTDEQVAQLRSIPGVHVARVMAYTAAVYFPGDLEQINALLAGTKWAAFYMGENRIYRLSNSGAGRPVPQ